MALTPEGIKIVDLQKVAAELMASIKARELAEEEKLVKTLTDREALIVTARELQRKFDEAQETERIFTEADLRGKLDDADRQKFEWVSGIVKRLEELLMDVNGKIAIIEGKGEPGEEIPEARTPQEKARVKLYDEAREEDAERFRKKELARAEDISNAKRKELSPRIAKIVKDLIYLGNYSDNTKEDQEKAQSDIREKYARAQAIIASFARILQADKKGMDQTARAVESLVIGREPLDQVIPFLQKIHDGLWFYQGKKKEIVGQLIGDLGPVIKGIEDSQKSYEGLGNQLYRLETRVKELSREYGAIMEEAELAEAGIGKLEGRWGTLPEEFRLDFDKKVKDAALERIHKRRGDGHARENERNNPMSSELNKGLAWAYGRMLSAYKESKAA